MEVRLSPFINRSVEKAGRNLSYESRTMSGRRREFDWREVAEGLRLTRATARRTFWREIKGSRSRGVKARSPGTVSRDEPNSHALKLGGPRASR